MSSFNTRFYNFTKEWAASDERLMHTDEDPSVFLCNSFMSRIQTLQHVGPEKEYLIMIDINRAKSDSPNLYRNNTLSIFFCCRAHEFTDFEKLNEALDRAEELMDDFTGYLVSECKKAKKRKDGHVLKMMSDNQEFPADTIAPYDGGWCCYEMIINIPTNICRTPTSQHRI